MKIASLQYQYSFPKNFTDYKVKITRLVADQAKQGINLLLFPEYAGLELLSFISPPQFSEILPEYFELFAHLSHQHRIWICAGSQFVKTGSDTFNRVHLFSPNGKVAHQDKCILTPYEVGEGILKPGRELNLIDTEWGKIGIAICYDAEFPSLVRRFIDGGARLILVPSYTSSVHGYYRVFLSCRARALENQCYVVQSPLVGQTDVEMAYGAAAICGPVDHPFPEDGILALGSRDLPLSIQGTLDFSQLDGVRQRGQTRNWSDGVTLGKRNLPLVSLNLR